MFCDREVECAEDAGIEGILSRLKKERSLCYAYGPKEIEGYEGILTKLGEDNLRGISANAGKLISGFLEAVISNSLILVLSTGNE